LVDGDAGRMMPEGLRAAMAGTGLSVHNVQRGPVSITQATEVGTIYTCAQIAELADVAKSFGSKVHLDGARFANALVNLNCSPADMTWRAGVDAVSLGGTKNGCGMVEAVVFFDPSHAWEFELRRKRGAHLFSKHRYLSGQMAGYLQDGLWLETARQANAACMRLADGLRAIGGKMIDEPQANMIFATLPRAAHRRAMAGGAQYYLMSEDSALEGDDDTPILCRLVCDWSKTDADIDQLVALLKG
jgi:threonine aldolase